MADALNQENGASLAEDNGIASWHRIRVVRLQSSDVKSKSFSSDLSSFLGRPRQQLLLRSKMKTILWAMP